MPHPAAPHTSQRPANMACLMHGETSIIRAEAETTVENTKERGRADAGHNRLWCRSAPLIQPQWQFDGCTWGDMGLYLRVYMHVYRISMVFTHSPLILFSSSLLWRGIFLWQAASVKAIKNSQTVHHNGRYHLGNACSLSLADLVWNGLAIFNLCTTKPTYRRTANWMKGRGMRGHGNCLLWSSNVSVLP